MALDELIPRLEQEVFLRAAHVKQLDLDCRPEADQPVVMVVGPAEAIEGAVGHEPGGHQHQDPDHRNGRQYAHPRRDAEIVEET
jgi:hypothetical protein